MAIDSKAKIIAYIGTYTRSEPHVTGTSRGIPMYEFDAESGALKHLKTVDGVDNPSFLAIHPNKNYLYAVNEVGDYQGESSGAISAFEIDPQSGDLTLLNQEPTYGAAPCHLSIDQSGRYALIANYGGGSIAVYPLQADGRLGKATSKIQHEGASVNPQRQGEAHAHSITVGSDNQTIFVADLGIDKVMIYRLNLETGELSPHNPAWIDLHPGAGPRHFDIHPSQQYAYVINELDSTITVFAYDMAAGTLNTIQSLSTLPEGFEGPSSCADIHVSPSGRFVYGSNRGHDSIAIFAVDEATGQLSPLGHTSTQGKTPRNFALDPSSNFLLAANQDTNDIVSFAINQETGQLSPTGHVVEAPTPVCIKFLKLGA